MAPHSSHKRRVKFARSRSPVPRKKTPRTAESYANIVLYYLSKLKGIFHSPSRSEEIPDYYDRKMYENVKSILKKDSGRSEEAQSRQKAYEIVNAALQYGCANNIIEKVGEYFLVKNRTEQKVSTRRPTPGPEYIRCASCKNLAKYSKCHRSSYCEDDDDKSTSSRRKRSNSNTSVVNYCPKCYNRMKAKRRRD